MSPIFQFASDLYREMRQEFELTLEAAYAAAELATNGVLLNRSGRSEPIDPYSLLTGPWSRVERWASEELIEHFQTAGRPSVAEFEREWFGAWLGDEDAATVDASPHTRTANHLDTYPCPTGWAMGGDQPAHECNLADGHPGYHLCRCGATGYVVGSRMVP